MNEKIRQLEAENTSLKVCIAKQEACIAKQGARIAELEEAIRDLRRLNSKNSSKPSSQDWKDNTKEDQNKGGAQSGHKSCQRARLEPVDKVIVCKENCCPRCGEKAIQEVKRLSPKQHIDISKTGGRVITDYVQVCYHCPKCKRKFSSKLPSGVTKSPYGAKLQAIVASLIGQYRTSHRQTQSLLLELFGIPVAVGTITKCIKRVVDGMHSAYSELKNAIRKTSDPVHVDETGWRESGKNHYAWVACTKEITLISIRESRARREFENILAPAAKQAIVTDRYSAYMKAKGPHQFCLAHIIRNCQRYAEKTGIQRIVGQGLVKELKEVFNLWIEYKNDRLDLRQFRARTNYRRGKLKEWLYDGICHPTHKKLQRFCKGLLKDFDCLWTYLRIPDMEPTNNAAERDIRHLVLKRKIGFGSKSRIGSTFIERLCSIMQTLRKKKQSLLHFLTATMRNFFSLLPPPQPLA